MKTYDITPIIENIHKTVESHRVETGSYARWLWQNEKGDRELGPNPYGCADAANLLYMLGKFPRVTDERSEWIEAMREMQDKESGLFYEKNINILDISQKLMQNLFTMIALVDMEKSELDLAALTAELDKVGEELNVAIRVLPEENFEV